MYVQYKKPNQEALAALISNLRGDRTLAKYADDIKRTTPRIKVSASTLSRACNCGENPVSYELLEAIAAISENPETTLAHLLEANGTRSQEDDAQLARKSAAMKRREFLIEFEKRVTMILQNEIVSRGYQVRQLSRIHSGMTLNTYVYQRDRMFPRIYDLGYSVSGMSPCSTWKFMLNQVEVPQGAGDSSIEGHVGHFINKVASVFASDNYESEYYESEKYSFVFIDRRMYDLFLKRINDHDIMVNGLMTAILVDYEGNAVVEETQIKRYDGEEAPSFFKQQVIQDDVADDEIADPFDFIDDEE